MNTPHDPTAALVRRLATSLRERAPAAGAELELALTALFAALQDGHTCVALADVAAAAAPGAPLGDVATLRTALLASGVVAGPDLAADAPLPLSLDGRDRLALRRHRTAEHRLAAALRSLATPVADVPAASLAALRALASQDGQVDWQAIAVAAALRSRLAVVTGGPGTGKTTAIVKMLAALLAGAPELQIALCAPTGKAAARMTEALALPRGEAAPGAAAALPRATTLHRLLGYLALEDGFRRNAASPLPHDVVVVDEASMVDLELMDALLAALKPTARLVLLGDRDQLSSVAAGQVLGDLCHTVPAATAVGPGLAAFVREHLGVGLPVTAAAPFADHVVALRRNWRFAESHGIGAFAAAVAARDADAAIAALQRGSDDLRLVSPPDANALLQPFGELLQAQVEASSAADALAKQATLRVLCAVRHGPFGVDACNAAVEALLRARAAIGAGPQYRGRPLLITSNDPQTGLFNGDLGVLWPDDEERLLAWFPGQRGGEPRKFLPLRLPPHETAWAITVHKSQGSEFDEVLAVLPDRDSALLHAPLVYTAVTRARRRATVAADVALLRKALATQPARVSGLFDLLAAAAAD
jgi:exodeoxyribonuclease V alpha subunit